MNEWKPIHVGAASLASAAIGLVLWRHAASPEGWVRILDDANLIFHEAGHPIFGLLGSTAGLYGGTLGQLVFPAATSIKFWREDATLPFALCLAWFFENFLNIARYMADARAQVLPLVGSGEHDWTEIFSRWGVLPYDTRIASFISVMGWLGMIGCAGWLLYQAFGSYPKEGN